MSGRRSCLQRDEENKKTAKKIKIGLHQVFFNLGGKKTAQPLLICLRCESLQEKNVSVSMHPRDIRHRSAAVDK